MSNSLSTREAYAAMFSFLDEVFDRTQSDDLGSLLGGMSLLPDGGTADPAVWGDWEKAVRRVKDGKADIDIGLE